MGLTLQLKMTWNSSESPNWSQAHSTHFSLSLMSWAPHLTANIVVIYALILGMEKQLSEPLLPP